jgi:hypothetical protein
LVLTPLETLIEVEASCDELSIVTDWTVVTKLARLVNRYASLERNICELLTSTYYTLRLFVLAVLFHLPLYTPACKVLRR